MNYLLCFRWFVFVIVFTLNFIAYWNDYNRYSTANFMFSVTNRVFTLIAGITTLLFDCFTLLGLLDVTLPVKGTGPTTSFLSRVPLKWLIVLVVLLTGIVAISMAHTVTDSIACGEDSRPVDDRAVLNQKQMPRRWRVYTYTTILSLNLVVAFGEALYNYHTYSDIRGEKGSRVWTGVIMVFGTLLGLLADLKALHTQTISNHIDLCLPDSWAEPPSDMLVDTYVANVFGKPPDGYQKLYHGKYVQSPQMNTA